MSSPDTTETPPPPPGPPKDPILLASAGFACGAVLAMPIFVMKNDGSVLFLLFDLFVAPFVAIVLSIIRKTRAFGLGMLLACLVGWLWLLALCGKAFGGI